MDFINRGADAMSAYERSLSVVSDNLANLSTPGYRAHRLMFQQSSSGAVSTDTTAIPTGGQLQATHVPTDLAIQGDGYFVVQNAGGPAYTRDGSFHMDPKGNLLYGSQNLAVLGYPAANGTVSGTLSPLQIPVGQATSSHGSSTATATGNLDASAAVYVPASGSVPESGGVQRTQTTLYDSLGNAHTVNVTFTKTATNTWSWTLTPASGDSLTPGSGQLAFDSTGKPTTPNATLTLTPGGGAAANQPITLDFSQLTQTAGASSAAVQADAFQSGTLSSFTVGTDGTINGQFSNGATQVLGRVALARFADPAGLSQLGGNLLSASDSSGPAQIGTAGQGPFGTISQGNLEGSNVDLSVEFERMIISQRAYQANSRVMQAGDQMWQELMDLRH